MKKGLSIPLIVLMYLLIFNPPIFTFNVVLVMAVPSLIYILLNWSYLQKTINISKVLITELVLVVLLVYTVVIAVINANPLTTFSYLVYWIFGDVPFAVAAWIHLKKRGQGIEKMMEHIMAAGLLMTFTALLAMAVPSIKALFVQRLLAYGISYAEIHSSYRYFGFATNLTSTAPMLLSVLASIALYKGIKGKKLYYVFFFLLTAAAVINARSSLLFILGGLIAIFIALLKGKRASYFAKYLFFGGIVVLAAILGMQVLKRVNLHTYEWLLGGFNQIIEFVSGDRSGDGYFTALSEMTTNTIPKGIHLLFGYGVGTLGGNKYGVGSDVGFISDLWRGGIIYSATVIILFLGMLKRIRNSRVIDSRDAAYLSWLWFFVFLLDNIKGSFFIHSDLTVVFWLLYTAIVFGRHDSIFIDIGIETSIESI